MPFLAGGTGLYVDSVTSGYVLSDREPDLVYHAHLETMDAPELYAMLVVLRPDVDVEPRNRNRVMRMLEKTHDGNDHVPHNRPRYDCLKLGVTRNRETPRRRIDERLRRRLDQGMIDEVRGQMERSARVEFLMKLGLEYRFIAQYLTGEIPTKAEMVERLALAIKQFAKRQMTWFRRDPEILWPNMAADPVAQACEAIDQSLEGARDTSAGIP